TRRERLFTLPAGAGRSRAVAIATSLVSHHRGAVQNFFEKNTIDLQWKMRANYNARLWASLRKAAVAKTMKNNGKNNAQNNGNNRKSKRLPKGEGLGLSEILARL